MSESFLSVPLHFTIEFLGFLAAAGGAILALARPVLVPGDASNRVTASLGFGVLAVAQVAHGGGFVGADGDELMVAARALGYALVLFGILGGLRVSAVAAVPALRIEQPLAFAPAAAAFMLGGAAFFGSLGNGPKVLRRLALGSLALAGAEVLIAIDPEVGFGAETVSAYQWGAHAFKAAGYFALGAWFWSAVKSSIRTRFVAAFAVLLVTVVAFLSSSLTGVLTNNVEAEKLASLREQLDNAIDELEIETAQLAADVRQIATGDGVRGQARSTEDLRPLAEAILDLDIVEFDFVLLSGPKGELRGFAHDGRLSRVDVIRLNGSDVVNDVIKARPSSASPIRVGDRHVALAASQRVTDPDDPRRTTAILTAGTFIDQTTLEGIAARLASPVSLLVGDELLHSTLKRPVRRDLTVPPEVRRQIKVLGDAAAQRQVLADQTYFSAFATVESPGGDYIATMVLSSPSTALGATRTSLTRILFLVAMAVGSIALVLAWFSGRRITRPIQMLTSAAGAVREGDLTVQAPVSGEDEVGRLGETFNEMTASLYRMTNDLRAAAREEYELRARIETIIQSMADGLVATDADRNIVAFNREAELIVGMKERRALGKPVTEVLDARDPRDERVHLPIFDLAPGSVDNIYIARRNGDRIPVALVSAVLTSEEGEVAGGVAVLRDMTREREIERMKTEFLSNISHELRTPLTPIKGYAEILGRKDIAPDKAKRFAAGILESTQRLERIVELLVDFAALEAGRLAPRAKPVDLAEVLGGLAEDWGQRLERHEIVVELDEPLPRVEADIRLLKRSLNEVIDNAVKFSPDGGTIRLVARGDGAQGRDRRHRSVAVSVVDEGIGIPPEDVGRIFSDFHQLDGSETRTYGGLGLGLAFVQRIVEAHGGSIRVESKLGRGTRMTIELPAARRRTPEPDPERPREEPESEAAEESGEDAGEASAAN